VRKRVKLHTASESNQATNVWMEHLINRIIVEQLNLPHRLQAKILYETSQKNKNRGETK